MANVLTHQVVARSHHQMAAAQVAEVVQYLRHAHRDRGLAGAGMSGKGHMQGGALGAPVQPFRVNERPEAAMPRAGCMPSLA